MSKPLTGAAPSSAPKRPRITTLPHLSSPSPSFAKATASKPPLHNSASGAAAAAAASVVPLRHPAAANKPTKADASLDFSDNESIWFAFDNGSVAGGVSMTDALPSRRLESTGSIQFISEPGSRATSPSPKANLHIHPVTPAEKVVAPTHYSTGVKEYAASDSSVTFDHSHGSIDFGLLASAPSKTGKRTSPIKHGTQPQPARPPLTSGAAFSASRSVNESIAFHIEDSVDMPPSPTTAASPPIRHVATASNKSLSAKRAAYTASFVDHNTSDFVDNVSIAFMVEDDADEKLLPSKAPRSSSAKRDTGTPKAIRPQSPSIQFDTENTENENATGSSETMLIDHSSPPLSGQSLPVFGHSLAPTSSLPPPSVAVPQSLKASLVHPAGIPSPEAAGNASTAAVSSTTSPLTKKTVVTNHLQQRQSNYTRLPQPPKSVPKRLASDAEAALSGRVVAASMSHPTAVSSPPAVSSTSSAANAMKRRPSSSSHTKPSREKKSRTNSLPSTTPRQHGGREKQRSKVSTDTAATGVSPTNHSWADEESELSVNSPPEHLFTWHRSHSSGEIASSAASPLYATQKPLPASPRETPRDGTTEGYRTTQRTIHHFQGVQQQQQQQQHMGETVPTRVGGSDRSHPVREISSVHPQHACTLEQREEVAAGLTEAELWRKFNEKQRAELANLRKRIVAARREDLTLLEGSPSQTTRYQNPAPRSSRIVPQPTPMGMSYSRLKSTSPEALHQQTASKEDTESGCRGGEPTMRVRAKSPQTDNAERIKEYGTSMDTTAAFFSKSFPSPAPRPEGIGFSANPSSSRVPAMRSGSPQSILHSTEAASVANMLGIFWPPRTSSAKRSRKHTRATEDPLLGTWTHAVDLYFVNGSRLTQEQTMHFFELVRVQEEAVRDTATVTQRSTSALGILDPQSPSAATVKSGNIGAPVDPTVFDVRRRLTTTHSFSPPRRRCAALLSGKLAALLPKKTVRRSRVLREVFDVMDIKRQGSIDLRVLPSLTRLLEQELAAVEKTRASLLRGEAASLQTLLECAVAGRQRYASPLTGASEFASAGTRRSMNAVDGGALHTTPSTQPLQEKVTQLTHRMLLLSFAVNVIIPITSTSLIPVLDFATFCIIVYSAVDDTDKLSGPLKGDWRRVVHHYFVALAA